jgi:hypothetical protein
MRGVNLEKIVTYLLWISVALFISAVILPQGIGLTALIRAGKIFYVSMTLVLAKGILIFRKEEKSKALERLPFLALFLFCCFQLYHIPNYRFGVDDAYYYSYVSSVCIDKDLELSNQYDRAGLAEYLTPKALQEKTPVGKSVNIYPVGLSVLWAPFFLIGYLVAALAGLPLDGFSRPFLFSVCVGNLLLVCAGLYFCYLFCSAFASRLISLFSTFAVLFTTPSLYFFFRSFLLLSEPLSFALAAFFLWLLFRDEKRFSLWRWFLIGLLLGAMTMVRFHNFIFAIAPAWLFFSYARKEKNRSTLLRLAGVTVFGVMLGFLPQMIVWRLLYGEWFVSLAGSFLPWWKNPFFLETLFSSRKGLFPWAPATILCLCGIPFLFRKNRVWAWILLAIVLATIWMNSSQFDWWGATALGARRFIPLATIFVVLLALFYTRLPRIGRGLLIVLFVSFGLLNVYFARAFQRGLLQYEHADRFSDILTGPYQPFQAVVYPLEFPVQLAYHWKYQTPMYQSLTEFFIGEDVFYFQSRAGDQILTEVSPLFGEGWQVQDGQRKTIGSDAILYVPMFMKEKPRFLVQLFLEPSQDEKDVWIDFYWNGTFLRSKKAFSDGRMIEIAIRSRDYRSEVNALKLHIYHSRTEKTAAPQLILLKINFLRDEREKEP